MHKKHYISLDCETLSLDRDAVVLSVGIVKFSIQDSLHTIEELKDSGAYFHFSSEQQKNRVINQFVLDWRAEVGFEDESLYGEDKIQELWLWIKENISHEDVWIIKGNKDIEWLLSLFSSCEEVLLIKGKESFDGSDPKSYFYYRNVLDLRTMQYFSNIPGYENPKPHHALWDAACQAKEAIDCIFSLSIPQEPYEPTYYEVPLKKPSDDTREDRFQYIFDITCFSNDD